MSGCMCVPLQAGIMGGLVGAFSTLSTKPNLKPYQEIVREKIKEKIYNNYDVLEAGEVWVSMEVSRKGKLLSVSVGKDTVGSEHLINLTLNSIKQASPFPPIPSNLLHNSKKLIFNLSFSFEINNS